MSGSRVPLAEQLNRGTGSRPKVQENYCTENQMQGNISLFGRLDDRKYLTRDNRLLFHPVHWLHLPRASLMLSVLVAIGCNLSGRFDSSSQEKHSAAAVGSNWSVEPRSPAPSPLHNPVWS